MGLCLLPNFVVRRTKHDIDMAQAGGDWRRCRCNLGARESQATQPCGGIGHCCLIDAKQQNIEIVGANALGLSLHSRCWQHDKLICAGDAMALQSMTSCLEHIQDDALFLREIHRVLKPGGTALLTTPNRKLSLTRNPWHIREYSPIELEKLSQKFFTHTLLKGITGNKKVMTYYEANKKSVERITRFDIFNLQHRLPAALLRLPYEILNRWNRNTLQASGNSMTDSITHSDYIITDDANGALDLLLIVKK